MQSMLQDVDDDLDLNRLLNNALESSEDIEVLQELGQLIEARLTDAATFSPTVHRLWENFVTTSLENGAEKKEKDNMAKAKVLHSLGWDLFGALIPWARGEGDGKQSLEAPSPSFSSSTSSSIISPFLIPLMNAILASHTGRERLIILQEAMSQVPHRTHPSFVPWLIEQMPSAHAMITGPTRVYFIETMCRMWHEQVGKAWEAMEQNGSDGEDDMDQDAMDKENVAQMTKLEAHAVLMAVLAAMQNTLTDLPARTEAGKEKLSGLQEEAALSGISAAYVVGLLLSLLARAPPVPPPLPPLSHPMPLAATTDANFDVGSRRSQGEECVWTRHLVVLLAQALSSPWCSFQDLLRHHRGLHEGPGPRPRREEGRVRGEEGKEGKGGAEGRPALSPSLTVASTPFAWEPLGLSLATYHLIVHPPSLPAPVVPRVLHPLYLAPLLALPAARLLQNPSNASCGLALLERGPLPILGPSVQGETEMRRGWEGGEGRLHCRARPGSEASGAGADTENTGRGTPSSEASAEEDTWLSLVRGLTACMVFLADDALRQRAYQVLPRVLRLLTYTSQYHCLATALPRAHHPSIQALFISYAQKSFLLATRPNSSPLPASLPPSPWHQLAYLRVFYAPTLSQACQAKPELLVSWASTDSTSKDAAGSNEGRLDVLLSALNFYRLLCLKGWVVDGEEESRWWPALTSLRRKLHDILRKPHQRRNAFRLAMVEEVVDSVIGTGEGKWDEGEGVSRNASEW